MLATLSRAAACDETWASTSTSGAWGTAGNWTPASVPTGLQNVCLPAGSYTVTVTGSQVANSITVGSGVTLAVAINSGNGAALTLSNNGTSSNDGTIELTSDGSGSASTPARVELDTGATLTNNAGGSIVSNASSGSAFIDAEGPSGGVAGGAMVNNGTMTIDQNLQIDSGQGGTFTTSGNITINSGEKLLIDPAGGLVTGSPGYNTAGLDIEGGTITDNGTFEQGFSAAGTIGGAAALTVNGGTITGAGLIAVGGASDGTTAGSASASFSGSGSGTYTFVGSASANPTTLAGTIGSGQTVVFSASTTDGGVPVQVNSGLINNGTLTLTDSDTSGTNTNTVGITIATGQTLASNGTIAASGAHGQRAINGPGTLVNSASGTVDVGGDLQIDSTGNGTFTNDGAITVPSAHTLWIAPNGASTFSLNAGSSITNNGTADIGVNTSGGGAGGATFNVNGTASGNPIVVADTTTNFSGSGTGAFTLEGGGIFGGSTVSGTIDANDTVTVSGSSTGVGSATITTSGTVINDGTLTLTDTDTTLNGSSFSGMVIPNTYRFTNAGTMTIAPGADASGYRSIDGTLTNTGTLNVDMLLQLSLHNFSGPGGLVNSGSVSVAAGQAIMDGRGTDTYSQSAGSTSLPAGSDLAIDNVTLTGGTLSGAGTICGPGGTQSAPCNSNAIAATVTNGGSVSPSPSPSKLTLDGNYTQTSSGTLDATVTGVGANDQLAVSGTATLAGTLSVSTASGYNPSDLNYVVLTAAGVSGTFATTQLSSGPYTIAYNNTNVTLTGASIGPAISFSPTSLTFGSASNTVAAGATVKQTLTITNIGNAALNVGTLSLTGPQASSFSLSADGCSGTAVPPNGSCQAIVAFSPAAAGAYSATLNVGDNASGSPQPVALSGTAGAAGARASVSPTSLTFAETKVGAATATQKVTVTSTGSGPLKVSSVNLGGADAGDFKLTDGCAGQSLAPGASCTTNVAFAPTSAGSRSSTVSYVDNAPDTPQTVAVSGPGTDDNLAGRVTASGQPASASVYACPSQHPQTASCVSTQTAADGTYQLQLTPGAWLLQVNPYQGGLFGATATLDVSDALTVQDFTLTAPTPLTGGLSVDGQTSGVPTIYYNAPYTLNAPLPIPGTGKPDSTQLFIGSAGLEGGYQSSQPSEQFGQAAMILMTVHYDASGNIAAISNPILGALPCQASAQEAAACASLFQLSAGPGSGPEAQRRPVAHIADQTPPGYNCYYVQDSSLQVTNQQLSPNQYGGFTLTTTYADGHQDVFIVSQVAIPQLSGSENQWVNVSIIDPINGALTLGKYNPIGWYNTAVGTLGAVGAAQNSSGGSAAQFVSSAAWQIAAQGIGTQFHGAAAVYWNWMGTQTNNAITDGATIDAKPTGYCKAKVANAFIDPSGTVKTTTGIPVAGATVTLQRSATAGGKPTALPNGSRLMSPGNRRNPDRTNALGQYGWDVFPGYYEITAGLRGCTAPGHGRAPAHSRLLPVPPVQTGVDLVLRCPGLHRTKVRMSLKIRPAKSKTASYGLVATVRGRGPHPQGYVTFKLGGRLLGETLVQPATGVALLPVSAEHVRAGRVLASYGGDAHHAPASARARL